MPASRSLDPNFTPGNRLSRLPARSGEESLKDFYRDLFATTGPDQEQQRLLRALDEDVTDGAAAKGRAQALDHLDRAFRRIETWTSRGDPLPAAGRTELKRRVAHNLLAVRPGLVLADQSTPAPDRALLREVQDEHTVWRQGWTIGPENAPYGRRPRAESSAPRRAWDEQPDAQQPRLPWDEQTPRREQGPIEALRRLDRGEPRDPATAEPRQQDKKPYWYVVPKPAACDKCLAMAGTLFTQEPERPHPNCKCRIVSCRLTPRQAAALQDDLARQAQTLQAEHERIEHEKQAAKIKAKTPVYMNDSEWKKDGDRVRISGEDKNRNPAQGEFQGYGLPQKTPGGVTITYGKATMDGPTADRRVTKEMRDTVQEVLDDPRVKAAGVTSVNISCTTNGAHEPGSAHYDGRAVDISRINGDKLDEPKDSATPERGKVIQEVVEEKQREGKVLENYGPESQSKTILGEPREVQGLASSHQNHIHISTPKVSQ